MQSLLLIDLARTIGEQKRGSSDPVARAEFDDTPCHGLKALKRWLVSVALATAGLAR